MRGYPDPKSVGHNAHTVPLQESPIIERRELGQCPSGLCQFPRGWMEVLASCERPEPFNKPSLAPIEQVWSTAVCAAADGMVRAITTTTV